MQGELLKLYVTILNVGEQGLPRESGGNVSIRCKEASNLTRWTIKSIGGTGSHGQNGGNG
jgi:hypothetical protein